jgi:hypothetical protein
VFLNTTAKPISSIVFRHLGGHSWVFLFVLQERFVGANHCRRVPVGDSPSFLLICCWGEDPVWFSGLCCGTSPLVISL